MGPGRAGVLRALKFCFWQDEEPLLAQFLVDKGIFVEEELRSSSSIFGVARIEESRLPIEGVVPAPPSEPSQGRLVAVSRLRVAGLVLAVLGCL